MSEPGAQLEWTRAEQAALLPDAIAGLVTADFPSDARLRYLAEVHGPKPPAQIQTYSPDLVVGCLQSAQEARAVATFMQAGGVDPQASEQYLQLAAACRADWPRVVQAAEVITHFVCGKVSASLMPRGGRGMLKKCIELNTSSGPENVRLLLATAWTDPKCNVVLLPTGVYIEQLNVERNYEQHSDIVSVTPIAEDFFARASSTEGEGVSEQGDFAFYQRFITGRLGSAALSVEASTDMLRFVLK